MIKRTDSARSSLFTKLGSRPTFEYHKIGKATQIVATAFNWSRVVDRFVRDDIQGNIKIFLSQNRFARILDREAPRVFLWVRINKTKLKATAHLELDTSVEGLRQITRKIVAANELRVEAGLLPWVIVLTGDRIDLGTDKNKVLRNNCVDMMEYWKDGQWRSEWGTNGAVGRQGAATHRVTHVSSAGAA